jgi:hypothetical protein
MAADAVRGAELIFSAVTAASSVAAAQSIKPHLAGAPYVLDINSVSPGRKQETAKLLGNAGRYVDVAILAPIRPVRHQTPMLLARPHAQTVAPVRSACASASPERKRSSRRHQDGAQRHDRGHRGVDAGVLPRRRARRRRRRGCRLDEEQLSAKIVPYNLERMVNHDERRAAEMEEVADTLRELGVEPLMTAATVKRQREMGQIGSQQAVRGTLNKDRVVMLGAVSAAARDRH